ncbi:MAG TPA: FMN-binding protein [Ktedonobacteraceae bacterium]|jgi:uncharacterized protein with FMN-binding domain|nr:FMN-binding protein [Ktedonobacteraceae bacterium]
MKKFMVAVLIIGAFIFYSFIYDHSNPVAAVPSSTSEPSSSSSSSSSTPANNSAPSTGGSGTTYKDGTYTGSVEDAFYGNIQVKVVIQNGKITSVPFLQYPNDRSRSQLINSYADPQLSNEAIQAQSAHVDIVSGATDSSEAFIQSLSNALTQAKA